MGERFYRQQIEAIGSCPGDPNPTRRRKYAEKMARMEKPKRRLKSDVVSDIYDKVESKTSLDKKVFVTEFSKLTVKALVELENIVCTT